MGQLDSLVGPGPRTSSDKTARKQSFVRDRFGVPVYEFPGNGSYVGRVTDWRGRVKGLEQSYVDPTRSMDGEHFAAPADSAAYAGFFLTMGRHLSAGQSYQNFYDSKGRRIEQVGRDHFHVPQTDRRWGYTRGGALIADTLLFQDGATVIRRYEYNRRGQRTAARSTITLTSGTIGEASDSTVSTYHASTARLSSLVGWSGPTRIATVRGFFFSC